MSPLEQIQQHLRSLRMPTAVETVAGLLTTATRETWPLETFLSELLAQEIEGRSQRRVERLQKSSRLPAGKTLAAFDQKKLPLRLTRQLAQLCSGEFVTRAENLLTPAPTAGAVSLDCPELEKHTSLPRSDINSFRLDTAFSLRPPFTWWTNSYGQNVTCYLSANCAASTPTK
jgi:hypothetical protein